MFSAIRALAIDDQQDYLDQLMAALHESGISCLSMCYPSQQPLDIVGLYSSVRVLFSDLHLIPTARNPEQSYGVIGTLLEKVIPDGGGPLLLVLWTAYPKEVDELSKYLLERFPSDKQPTAIVSLAKEDFQGERRKDLPAAILARLAAAPQFGALLTWESDVIRAATSCTSSLYMHASKASNTSNETLAQELDYLFGSLSYAATGKILASKSPGRAVYEALVPLLADDIRNFSESEGRADVWKAAMTSVAEGRKIPDRPDRVAAVNTTFNVVRSTHRSPVNGNDRGAVISVDGAEFPSRFSKDEDGVLEAFALKSSKIGRRWMAIQIEAICDYSQQKSAVIQFVLALEVPANTELKERGVPDSIWESPRFLSERGEEVRLIGNTKYVWVMSPNDAAKMQGLYRFREQLTSDLAYAKARSEARPGYISLR